MKQFSCWEESIMPKHSENFMDSSIFITGDSLNISPQRINRSNGSVKDYKDSYSNQVIFKNESQENNKLSTISKNSSKFGSTASFTHGNHKRNGSNSNFKESSREVSHSVFQPLTARLESSEELDDTNIQNANKYKCDTSRTKMESFFGDEASSIAEKSSVISSAIRSAKYFRGRNSTDSFVDVDGMLFGKQTELKNGTKMRPQADIDAAKTIQKWIRNRFTKIREEQLSKDENQSNVFSDGSSHSLKFNNLKRTKQDDSRRLLIKNETQFVTVPNSKQKNNSDISKRVSSKYAWLTHLENTTDPSNRSIEHSNLQEEDSNEYLSQDKYNSVVNYLRSMKPPSKVLGSLDSALNKREGKLVRHGEPIDTSSNDNIGSKDKESKIVQSIKEEPSKITHFKLEEKKYKETISRHLKFIDQLIGDKKHLTETLEDLQNKCRNLTQQFQKEIKTKEESHSIEVKKMKDIHAAAEQIKRERWIKNEANRIKELTAKGFEPALQKLISNHKAEVDKLKKACTQDVAATEERASEEIRRVEERHRKEMEEAVVRTREDERRICNEGFKKILSQEHDKFNKERQKLEEIINNTRDEMRRSSEKKNEEFEMLKRNMEDAHTTARNVLKREYEDARRELEIRREAEIKDTWKQHELEKSSWETEFFMKHREEFSLKEKEMREKLKKERDREIELALEKLEDEHQAEMEQVKKDAESQMRKLQEKHEKELKLFETAEESMRDKNNKLKSSLFETKDEIEKLKSTLKQKDGDLLEAKKLLAKRNEERDRLTEVIRQEVADKMAHIESENKDLKQQICDLKARHRTEIKKTKSDALTAIKLKDEEVQEIHRRVKDVLSKRTRVEEDLRRERDAAVTRADYIQQLLVERKENASLKNKPQMK